MGLGSEREDNLKPWFGKERYVKCCASTVLKSS